MNDKRLTQRLTIDRLGQRGEGIARATRGLVFVPHAVPGDVIEAEVSGERGRLVEIVTPGPDRIAAFCPHFGICGGCAVQTLAEEPYRAWKRQQLVAALEHAGIETTVDPLVDAHGEGRRRATFHARTTEDALGRQAVIVGFMQARAHEIVAIDQCPVLAPSMSGALDAARGVANVLKHLLKPLDIIVTATLEGLDIDVRGTGPLDPNVRAKVVAEATRLDAARISNHGEIVIERRIPLLRMGRVAIAPPPGMFLQATEAGETILADLVQTAVGKPKRVADLFAGIGTFTARLAERSDVFAIESDKPAMQALLRGVHNTPNLHGVKGEARDLFRRPLAGDELKPYEAVVFDPPRAGAEAQAAALAASDVPVVVAVSCNVQTFARDARLLIGGGYVLEHVTPVDQFRYSAHLEMIGTFAKSKPKGKRRGRLLG